MSRWDDLGVPQRNTCDLIVRIPRRNRMDLHFHLEASDGLGYLEDIGLDDRGRVVIPPDRRTEAEAYLRAAGAELELEILGEE